MKCILILLVAISSFSCAFASDDYPVYDFTFYNSVQNSIATINEERFGIDYSGYGYLGDHMTMGIYLRFGIQTPYKTILDIIGELYDQMWYERKLTDKGDREFILDDQLMQENEQPEINEEATIGMEDKLPKDYRISLTLGPAFRKFISDEAIWYAGTGLMASFENKTSKTDNNALLVNNFDIKIAFDLDTGFRLDLAKRTTMRLGVNAVMDILSYSSTSHHLPDGKNVSLEQGITVDVFQSSRFSVIGYISLATTFKPRKVVTHSYVTRSRELGEGQLL